MKKIKRFILLFVVTALASISTPQPISANNVNITLPRSGVIRRGYYEAKNSKGDIIKTSDNYDFQMIHVNGIEAFCIEPEVSVGSGGGYTVSSFNHAEREMFSRIIYHGYDNTNKTNRDYVVTQHVLWNYIDSIRNDLTINTGWYFEGFDYNDEKTKIMNKVNAHNNSASFHGTVHNIIENETLTLNDTNGVLTNSTIIDNGGMDVTFTNNQLKVTAKKGSPTKAVVKFKKYGNINNDTATTPLLYSHPTQQNVIAGGNPDPIVYNVTFNVEHNGTLRIGKVNGETNALVSNTKFELSKNKDMSAATTYTTQANGYTNRLVLLAGTYYYREIFVPSPLVINSEIKEVKIDPGVDTEVKVSNKVAKAQIEILKVSTNDDYIKGAIFEIKDSNGKVMDTLTTNTSGIAQSNNLPLGTYNISELFTPEPYVLDSTPRSITINYKDQNTLVVKSISKLSNKFQRSDLTLTKIENNWDKIQPQFNGIKLSDATIELYAKSSIYEGSKLVYKQDQLVGKEVTDTNGQVKFHNLPLGEYYAKESIAPKGYVLFGGVWDISIKYAKDKPTVEVTNTNSTLTNQTIYGKSKIHKTGKGGSEFLANATFGLYTSDGVKLDEYVTDKKGEVSSSDLRFGTYYWQELVAPKGYHLDDTKHFFTIGENDHESIIHLPIANEYIQAKILISKIDSESKEPLENVGFKILDYNNEIVTIKFQDGKDIIEKSEWFTDIDGEFLLEASLPYGSYTLIESSPLEGYKPVAPIKFSIDEKQAYVDIDIIGKVLDLGDIENDKIYGDLAILKLDKDTNETIANTSFEIYDSQMKLIDTITTDSDGLAKLKHLVYGQYFIKEIEVPYPYVIDSDHAIQQIFISEDGKVYEVLFENQTTSITISKNDKNTGLPIANTIFNLYDDNKNLLETIETDEDGLVEVFGYDFGNYFIEEIFVPEPYIINPKNKIQEFTLSSDSNNYTVKFENEKATGQFNLKKVDKKTSLPIADVTFNLYDITNIDDVTYESLSLMSPLATLKTNKDGIASIDKLAIERKYALIEKDVSYGYEKSSDISIIEFDYVDQDTQVVENDLTLLNERLKTQIQATKIDGGSKEAIKSNDFILELKDSDNNVIKPSSFKDGIYTWDTLALEIYYLTEIKAPAGYNLSKKALKIDTNKQVEDNLYKVEYINSKVPITGISNNTPIYMTIIIASGLVLITLLKKKEV